MVIKSRVLSQEEDNLISLDDIFNKLVESNFEILELTIWEFKQFLQLIPLNESEKISFKKPIWHDVPIILVDKRGKTIKRPGD